MAREILDSTGGDIEERGGGCEGEALRQQRYCVRIERRATSPIATTSFAGGVAPLLEALDNRGLLGGDAPPCVIELKLVQTKVANYYEQGVMVEITRS